ncbi:MAG: hypothetical protein AB7F25_09795 [Deferribacterales bacterium]
MDKSYIKFLNKYSGMEFNEDYHSEETLRFINSLNTHSDKKKILIFASYDLPVDPFRQYMPFLCDSFDFFIIFSNSVQNSPELQSAKDFTTIRNNYAQLKQILEHGSYDLILLANINLYWQWRFSFVKTFAKAPVICYERDFMTKMHVRNTDEMALLLHGKREYAEFIMETGDNLLKNADGIVCHFSDTAVKMLNRHNSNIYSYIPVWSSNHAETAVTTSENKLVYGGSLTPEGDRTPHGTFGNLLPIFSSFTKHAEVDIFVRTEDRETDWQNYRNCPQIKVFNNIGYDEYIKTISGNYLAGLCVMNFSRINETSNIAYKYIFVTKIFAYLAAGLPVIISSEYDSAASFLTENGLGVAYSNQDIFADDFFPDIDAIRKIGKNVSEFDFNALLMKQKEQFLEIFSKTML